jgi:hypothetical protein
LFLSVRTIQPETAHLTTNETEADTDLLRFEAHRRPLHYPRSIDHHIEAARHKRNANRYS